MTDEQLLRYSRHILLPQIDVAGQEKLLAAHVLVIGAGGLGSPVALYLASAGVGQLTICDGDSVDLTNLQRQVVHDTHAIGINKAESAKRTLVRINPGVQVEAVTQRVDEGALAGLAIRADVVVDASDNFATRHAVNRVCVARGKPLVSGAAVRFDGQVTVFDRRRAESACYHCLFPEQAADEEERCAVMGVFAPLVGIIGCTQAAETLKLILGAGETLAGRLLLLDGLAMTWRTVRFPRDPACPVCGNATNP